MSTANDVNPQPAIVGPLPKFTPVGAGILVFPQGLLPPKVQTEVRVLVWGYLLGSDGKPTQGAIGALQERYKKPVYITALRSLSISALVSSR